MMLNGQSMMYFMRAIEEERQRLLRLVSYGRETTMIEVLSCW